MVFVREIKKSGKIYRYLYKSKRVNGKVKSIYIGREEVKNPHELSNKTKKTVSRIKPKRESVSRVIKDDKWIIDKIIEFNKLMEDSMDFIIKNNIKVAVNHYNKLLNTYNELSIHVGEEEKLKLYEKTKQIYDRIQELN